MAGCRWEYLVEEEVLVRVIFLQDADISLLFTLLYVRHKKRVHFEFRRILHVRSK